MPVSRPLPFKISVLIFIKNAQGQLLLLERKKPPNQGLWSPIGGKLETTIGESPFECAIRETYEEARFKLTETDLHLFSIIAEKNYEGTGHWLMFLFNCKKPIQKLPEPSEEGVLNFFPRSAIDQLPLPETDRKGLWPIYDQYSERFISLRADCNPDTPLVITTEEIY